MGISPWLFVTATAVNTIIAAVLAVVITLGVGRRDSAEVAPAAMPGKEDARTAAKAKQLAAPVLVRPIELCPSARAASRLRLEALKPSRFPLQVRPEEAMQGSYILVLTGLPANATLSGATRMGSDSWLVAPGALRQLEIIVPEWSASVIELSVELRHANGAVAAQGKAWLAVPPPPVPQGAKLDQAAIKELLQKRRPAARAAAMSRPRGPSTRRRPHWEAPRRRWCWARPTTPAACGRSACSAWSATRSARAIGISAPTSSGIPRPRTGIKALRD